MKSTKSILILVLVCLGLFLIKNYLYILEFTLDDIKYDLLKLWALLSL